MRTYCDRDVSPVVIRAMKSREAGRGEKMKCERCAESDCAEQLSVESKKNTTTSAEQKT